MRRWDVSGKVALVTGGASGIGRATARLLATRGARVMIADIDGAGAQALPAELGPDHASVPADMADPADVAAMFDACLARFGRLDILVNNAGRTDDRGKPLLDHDAASFDALMSVNLAGTLGAARTAAQIMGRRGGGVVVNVASGAAFRALPLRGSYSASKAGVIALTRALARSDATSGARFNAVAPGFVRTELVDRLIEAGRLDPAEAAARIPLGRIGRPEEIAEAICFLASDAAAAVNGAVLTVDGGSQAFGGSLPPAEAVADSASTELETVAVLGGEVAEACAALLCADGRPALHLPMRDGCDPDGLTRSLHDIAAASGGLLAVIDASEPRAGVGAVQAVTDRFLTARAAGRVLCAQRHGAYACLIRRDRFGDEADRDISCEGIGMLVKTLACEWAAAGVRANAVASAIHAGAAEMLNFLASPQASFVTGSVVEI